MSIQYKETLIALIMAALLFLENWFGWSFGIGEHAVMAILAIATPVFVWFAGRNPLDRP